MTNSEPKLQTSGGGLRIGGNEGGCRLSGLLGRRVSRFLRGFIVVGWCSVALLISCGKVGEPLPPAPRLPLRTRHLSATQRGPFIILQWPKPNVQTLESLGFRLRRIDVYRWVQPASATDELTTEAFADRATLIGSVNESEMRAVKTGEELDYRDGPIGRFDQRYVYAIRYVSTRGQSAAFSNLVSLIPCARVAAAPKNLQVQDEAQDVVRLTWDPPSQNIDGSAPPAILGYNVYRRTTDERIFGSPLNGTTLIVGEQFRDRQFHYGTAYRYAVRAVSRCTGHLVESESAEAIHTPRDTFPPAAPANVTAGSANGVISLFWAANTEPDLAGYNIYRADRADAPEEEWIKLNATVHTLNTFRDETTIRGKTYYYKVRAVDRAGNLSPPSTIVAQEAQ